MTVYLKLKTNDYEIYEIDKNETLQNSKKKYSYFQEILKKCFFKLIVLIKYFFHIITIKEIYGAYIFILPTSARKVYKSGCIYEYNMKKCLKKLKKMLKNYQINTVVLEDELKKDKLFVKEFLNNTAEKNTLTILNGKRIIPYLVYEIIEYILKKQSKESALTDIYLLMDENKQVYIDNIMYLVHKFKTINIITNNINAFQKIADKIEKTEGIPVTVSNNRRKGLRKARYIINFDFKEENLKKYSIYRKAIIVQVGENLSYESQTFGGIQVHNLDIDTAKEVKEFFEKYNLLNKMPLLNLYEGILKQNENFLEVRKKIKNDQIKVIHLCGKNGIIDESEYREGLDINS